MTSAATRAVSRSAARALAAIPGLWAWCPFGGLATGALAHAAKYGFTLVHAEVLGLKKHTLVVGVLKSFGYHLAFSAAGGLAAGFVPWLMARNSTTQRTSA